IDGLQRGLPQRGVPERASPVRGRTFTVEGDEPLGGRQENDRVMTPPAVRIRMLECLTVPEPLALVERFLDSRVRVEDALPAEELDGLQEVAAWTDGRVDLEPVLHAGVEVVAAMTGSRVHGARS